MRSFGSLSSEAVNFLWSLRGILRRYEAPDTIRAWFRGMNPLLDDKSPALSLRKHPQAVLAAARAFVESPNAAGGRPTPGDPWLTAW